MFHLIEDTDSRILAVVLALLMCGGWWCGCWQTRRLQSQSSENAIQQLSNASVALLGLLMAFTFSMAIEKHELRRKMVVEHANAIGDFATCANLQKQPVSGQLREILYTYVDHLVSMHISPGTEEKLQHALAKNAKMHDEMQSLVKVAVDDGTPIAIALVNTFNDLTSNHEERVAAYRNRLPPSIVLLLCFAAVISMFQIGMQHGQLDQRELATGFGFVLLVCMCICVTLDLNQPQQGMITVSQEPLQRLQSNLRQ